MRNLICIMFTIAMLATLVGCTQSKALEIVSDIQSHYAPENSNEKTVNDKGTEAIDREVPLDSHDYELAKNYVDQLTTHIISACNSSATDKGGKQSFDSDEINNFIFLTYQYMEDSQYIYHDLISENLSYVFSVDDVNRMVYEVFGIDEWKLVGGDVTLNSEKQQYETSLAFGVGGNLSCENISSKVFIDSNTIETNFSLTDNIGFKGENGWREYGDYSIAFQIMKEDDRVFLRFIKMSSM